MGYALVSAELEARFPIRFTLAAKPIPCTNMLTLSAIMVAKAASSIWCWPVVFYVAGNTVCSLFVFGKLTLKMVVILPCLQT